MSDAGLPDPMLRHAMELLCRRVLGIEITICQNREMATAMERWFSQHRAGGHEKTESERGPEGLEG